MKLKDITYKLCRCSSKKGQLIKHDAGIATSIECVTFVSDGGWSWGNSFGTAALIQDSLWI